MIWRHKFFFFSSRRRHTRLQGDWSSDVCSSDLIEIVVGALVKRVGGLLLLIALAVRAAAGDCERDDTQGDHAAAYRTGPEHRKGPFLGFAPLECAEYSESRTSDRAGAGGAPLRR